MYYTAKLTFFSDFPVNLWGAYYADVCIIFEFLRYVLRWCSKPGIEVTARTFRKSMAVTRQTSRGGWSSTN